MGFQHLLIITVCFVMGSVGYIQSESEFNEFNPRLKSPKNRFQLSAGFNFEKYNTILSGTNHI